MSEAAVDYLYRIDGFGEISRFHVTLR